VHCRTTPAARLDFGLDEGICGVLAIGLVVLATIIRSNMNGAKLLTQDGVAFYGKPRVQLGGHYAERLRK